MGYDTRPHVSDTGPVDLENSFDFSFDCVDQDILLNRLEKSFGFCGMEIGWIRSYLTGRKQYSGSMSTVTPVLFGVPQGSVLGPLLFVLYTAEVFRIAEELDISIHGYADDLQIYDHCLVQDTVFSVQYSILTFISANTHKLYSNLEELERFYYHLKLLPYRLLYRLYGPVDVEESPQIECVEDQVHLVGFTTSSGCMLIRFNRGRWKRRPTVAHSPGSRCQYQSSHQSR